MTDDSGVDGYLATLPDEQRALLQQVREVIARVVPDAVEAISYGMPAFKLGNRFFVSYAGWKEHCSIYPLTGIFLEEHAAELEGFDRTKGSLHFTPERPLPEPLLEALLRSRLADLEAGRR